MSHDGAAPTGQDTLDRRDILLEQFNKLETEGAASTEAPAKQETPEAEGRARDEGGRFVAKEKPEAVQVQAVASAGPTVKLEPKPWDNAPGTWKKEKHPLWASMSPEAREYAYEQEEKRRQGAEALIPRAELADKISKVAEPYMNTIRGLGIDLPSAVGGLMKVDHDLRTLPYEGKLQLLAQVARSYGVDLTGQLAVAQSMAQPEFQNIQNELLAMKGQWATYQEQQKAAADREAANEIQKFAKQAEHFDAVKPIMAQLLQSGVADGLQDAYDKAIRLSPEIFDQIQTAKQAAADADKRKAADEAAKKAKAAAVSVKTGTPGAQKTTNAQDRRSMLREQFDGLSERL